MVCLCHPAFFFACPKTSPHGMILPSMYIFETIVIGAGASGLMAAIHASKYGASTLVLEKNNKAGKKIFISGKGKGNVCNATTPNDFIAHVLRNPHFLHSAYANFGANETMAFFEEQGVPLVIERGKRVFPESMKAYDLTDALVHKAKDNGVSFHFDEGVRFVDREEDIFMVKTGYRAYACRNLIIATGGQSYPSTGSTGDGYRFARGLGHFIKSTYPGLAGLRISEQVPQELRDFTLKNVELIYEEGKKKKSEFGDITFRDGFVDGPIALTVSSILAGQDMSDRTMYLDLKPALTLDTLTERISRDIAKDMRMRLGDLLVGLIPSEFLLFFANAFSLDLYRKIDAYTKEERRALASALKRVPLHVIGVNPFERAIITVGGVDVKNINSSTMESKLVPNLYFAGEVMDVDALTGGFNMQIALSTGALAGDSIAEKTKI